jgi:hypothetical protein
MGDDGGVGNILRYGQLWERSSKSNEGVKDVYQSVLLGKVTKLFWSDLQSGIPRSEVVDKRE